MSVTRASLTEGEEQIAFYFWIGQAATTAGLVFGLVKITS